jgi:nicotinamidase-related amidase
LKASASSKSFQHIGKKENTASERRATVALMKSRNIMTDRDELYEIAQMIAHKPLLRGLRDKVAPRHTAIIVVDMQNDFVAKDGYITIPGCEATSWGADYYANLRPEVNDPVVVKHRYNAFLNTDLDKNLRANGIRTTVFTGVSTNCCVESTAREAFMRDYYVVVVDDATASYSRELHQAALKTLDALFGEITSIAALTEIWNRTNNAPPDDVCSGEFGVPI